MPLLRAIPVAALMIAAALPVGAGGVETSAGPMQITPVATGFDQPWGLAFLPDGRFLVTERDARRLWLLDGKARQEVTGLPAIAIGNQGGLLDVMVPHDFAETRQLWLTYTIEPGVGRAPVLARARLSADDARLEDLKVVFVGAVMPGGRHFGSRVVEAPDGSIFLTLGDRGTGPGGLHAQWPEHPEGKVMHFTADGLPTDTPAGALPGMYSLGHRNPQGAAIGPDGALWLVEHGPQGGDEVNRVEKGRNYGWPVITWGEEYGGGAIGEGPVKAGMEQPLHYWVPSIAPSGMMFYSGALVPEWKGDIFTGSLNSDFISRLDPDTSAEKGFAEERIAAPETARVRAVAEAPDGSIWFLSVIDGAVYRLAP